MDGERTSSHLQSLLESIKSSDVVECRIQLIDQLGNSNLFDKLELISLVKSLAGWIFWEDSTCLDVSQCMMNKSILHVAAKYLELNIPGSLTEFLSLGTKASLCCRKHLEMTLSSIDESQEEEHSSIFFQLFLDCLGFSASSFSAMITSPVLGQKLLMVSAEKFVFEQLNLIKASIAEIKRINSIASEVMKLVQQVLNASVRLCKTYAQVLSSEAYGRTFRSEGATDGENADNVNYVINLITLTADCMYELGILAATGDSNLVTVLNMSWKGVVTLLQLGSEGLAAKVNVEDIILSLISLAMGSLKQTVESWSSKLKEGTAVTEAKRSFLPVKFYLINAVRILSQGRIQVLAVYQDITLCILMISALGISLSQEVLLRLSSEALIEFLEPTSILLLHSLINSDEVKEETKVEILDWIFTDKENSSMDEIFILSFDNMTKARVLVLARVALFVNFLKSSPDLGEDVRVGISRKLGWFFNCLIDESVYSSILMLSIPVLSGIGPSAALVWQPMLSSVLHALKIYVVVASSSSAWEYMESFLLVNFLHPHFLFWEIVMELWCFIVRYADTDMVNDITNKLCSLFKLMASFQPALNPGCALRKMARSICMLLSYATQSMTDQVYNFIIHDGKTSCIMYIALLMEGFSLKSLSDGLKKHAIQRIITSYNIFIQKNEKKLQVDGSLRSHDSGIFLAPVYVISSALQCHLPGNADINDKTLKFMVAVIHGLKNATTGGLKMIYCKLLSEMLAVISKTKHLYASNAMQEVILELQTLLGTQGIAVSDLLLDQCKPNLALFMAGLAHMEINEAEGNAVNSALWEIYGMLLRERHWAFIHLAISTFGYFAARTSCNQLWRFVPRDAALSFDPDTGNETDDRFMSELKAFLDKEEALLVVSPSIEQDAMLVKEGLVLKETAEKISFPSVELDNSISDTVGVAGENHGSKKRKLPDGISEGVVLLQNGLKVMGDGLAQLQQQHYGSRDLQEQFSTQLSRLEDVITHLVGLAGNG